MFANNIENKLLQNDNIYCLRIISWADETSKPNEIYNDSGWDIFLSNPAHIAGNSEQSRIEKMSEKSEDEEKSEMRFGEKATAWPRQPVFKKQAKKQVQETSLGS